MTSTEERYQRAAAALDAAIAQGKAAAAALDAAGQHGLHSPQRGAAWAAVEAAKAMMNETAVIYTVAKDALLAELRGEYESRLVAVKGRVFYLAPVPPDSDSWAFCEVVGEQFVRPADVIVCSGPRAFVEHHLRCSI
jgi:hypothetical protein